MRSNMRPPERNSTLNTLRPSNPFTPTNEPDWVVVPQPTPSQTSTDHRTRQNAPIVALAGTARMLPPPSDLDYKIPFGNSRTGGDTTMTDRRQESKAPKRESVASSTTDVTRKPAPPVPKKPMLLSKSSSPKDSNNSVEVNPAPARRSTLASHENATVLLPPPRRNRVIEPASQTSQQSSGSHPTVIGQYQQGSLGDGDPPPLPRRAIGDLTNSTGLLDEDDDGARAIPSLEPLRRR